MATEIVGFDANMQEHLGRMQERVAALAVNDQTSYITASQVLNDTKAMVREWEKQADVEIDPIKDQLDRTRNKWKVFLEPGKQLVLAINERIGKWREAERKAAQAEQDKINEKARKEAAKKHVAAPPAIEVKPAIPTVAGVKNQVYYGAEVTDEGALIRSFIASGAERRAFLRQFITVNQQAVGKYARDTKDSEKVMADIPGSNAWSKG